MLAQDSLNIEKLDSLVRNYHTVTLDAELESYEDLKKLTWLLFIPGVGYDFINQNPYIVYNTSSLFSFFNQKLKQKHAKESMIKKSFLDCETDIIKLNRHHLRLLQLFEELELVKESHLIYSKLFEIKQGKYNNDEISLESLLLAEVQLNMKRKSLFDVETKIYDMLLQIEMLTHSTVNLE